MIAVPRTDTSLLGRWWWTVDRWTVVALALLTGIGALMVMAASPPIADRIGLGHFHFFQRHLVFLAPAAAVMFAVSLLSPTGVWRAASVVLVIALLLSVATLLIGDEVKGARRWLQIGGFSFQPSEMIKPAFAVVAARLFSIQRQDRRFPGDLIAIGLFLAVVGILALQPDFGMAVVVSGVWFAQYFMAGLPLIWVGALVGIGIAGIGAGYALLPHVQIRIDRFLNPESGDSYQVDMSLQAFSSGGMFGRGPGEGVVKGSLPDAHADFIFAVVGEEFGLLVCLAIVGLFAFVVLRGFARAIQEESLFVMLAAGGLLTQFGLQALLNMAVTLHLVPTKGMTLPFISYGGSSLISLALAMGMVLALTRRGSGARSDL
ncbi:MAG: putative peptidoglycan glycosyltransferase FtsW [Alphaproteobacteria bacterium]|jgi:cell division protein FtsW|nr:putative peptidoglycan glycosyltransferase FtsW [Alphaproteobacteria bacterium]MDP6517322.1 putative peptidoglycan glycosyltransferase FtsW [Alphaproteobacteria bacterium]